MPARVSAAHFLRGASGFGAVVFRERPLPIAGATLRADDAPGHADCSLDRAAALGWAWGDPHQAAITRAQECER